MDMMGDMAALSRHELAPDFTLEDADGGVFRLSSALGLGPVLATFFKTDCPTCQYALPYLDLLARRVTASGGTAIAVSQDGPLEGEMVRQEYGFETLQVFDWEEHGYAVSNAYGITNVPTVFAIEPTGRIAHTMVSWAKADVEAIARILKVPAPFAPGESVLPFRPG